MSPVEARDLVVVGVLLVVILLLVVTVSRRRETVIPPVVSPQTMPVEDQVRDVRHKVANLEQAVSLLPDHSLRIRAVEKDLGEMRAMLGSLREGQVRMEHHLNMLVEAQLKREERRG